MAQYDLSRLNALIASDAALHEEIRKERGLRDAFIKNARVAYEAQSAAHLALLVRKAQERLRGLRNKQKIPANSLLEIDPVGYSAVQLRSLLGSLQALFP